MKTTRLIATSFIAVAMTGLIFTGCKKEADDTDTQSASDNALAEGTYNDVHSIADQAANSGSLSTYKTDNSASLLLGGCAKITVDTSQLPTRKITVDFGP